MKNIFIIGLVATVLAGCSSFERDTMSVMQVKPMTKVKSAAVTVGQIENVVGLPIRPGNVMATSDGRVFSTVHPNDGEQGVQLFEVTGPTVISLGLQVNFNHLKANMAKRPLIHH